MPARPELQVYLVDADGVRDRVYDTVFGPPHAAAHQRKVLPFGDPRATERIVVSRDGTRRVAHRTGGNPGPYSADVLVQQLQRAGYLSTQPAVPPSWTPGRSSESGSG